MLSLGSLAFAAPWLLVGLAAIARATGWSFGMHRTDRPPHSALLALYGALAEPKRR